MALSFYIIWPLFCDIIFRVIIHVTEKVYFVDMSEQKALYLYNIYRYCKQMTNRLYMTKNILEEIKEEGRLMSCPWSISYEYAVLTCSVLKEYFLCIRS